MLDNTSRRVAVQEARSQEASGKEPQDPARRSAPARCARPSFPPLRRLWAPVLNGVLRDAGRAGEPQQ